MLAAIDRGRRVRLTLTPEQRWQLRDRDGRIGLDVLRHLTAARATVKAPDRFPLTEQAFKCAAARIGHRVGDKRAREIIRRLTAARVLTPAGAYRQPYRNTGTRSGYRVALYTLAALIRRVRSPHPQRPVGRKRTVKRPEKQRWWQHPLFGTPDGLPPPVRLGAAKRRTAKQMRSRDGVLPW